MSKYVIETGQLTKRYHGKAAVDGLNLQIPEGSIYGFLGPNGAGKSTTMKLLLGLTARDSGSIRIAGKELNDKSRISILRQRACHIVLCLLRTRPQVSVCVLTQCLSAASG